MKTPTSKSGIILPGHFNKKEEPSSLQMVAVEFTFDEKRFIMEISKHDSFLKSPPDQQTKALDRELRSAFNLHLLSNFAIAKDLAAAGIEPKNFKKLCETVGLGVVTKDGEQINIAKELENI